MCFPCWRNYIFYSVKATLRLWGVNWLDKHSLVISWWFKNVTVKRRTKCIEKKMEVFENSFIYPFGLVGKQNILTQICLFWSNWFFFIWVGYLYILGIQSCLFFKNSKLNSENYIEINYLWETFLQGKSLPYFALGPYLAVLRMYF